ncbi:ABC transporter permease [Amycolatopsis jiangsuensis]|uniref:Transport permease protein n=1 Tax=Amycolatopsis jiangsuensis TaxID=1181879 RepID=A0A840J2B3_9PSEU|nr:ABC transporter permease [Amycolatopsis jiangsuensis]MBB4688033.1 ABC-2 type transport system permease protein [Amycolatopsis jiangsuensis]
MTTTAPVPGPLSLGLARGSFELRQFFRNREQVVFTFTLPAVLMVLLGSILDGPTTQAGLSSGQLLAAGMIGAGIVSTSFTSVGIGIAADRETGALKRLRGTPMPPAAYFIGKVVMVAVTSVAQTVLMAAVAMLLFGLELPTDPEKWLTLLWVLVLGIVSSTLLGIAISSLTRTANGTVAVVQLVYLVLQFISGVFITPITTLPKIMVDIASFFPLKWICQGFRSVFLPPEAATQEMAGTWELPMVALVLGVWCVAGLLLARVTFRWTNEVR